MRSRTLEKSLYRAAILVVLVGAVLRIAFDASNPFGLYLIIAGHVLGIAGILTHMKNANEQAAKHQTTRETTKQLRNN